MVLLLFCRGYCSLAKCVCPNHTYQTLKKAVNETNMKIYFSFSFSGLTLLMPSRLAVNSNDPGYLSSKLGHLDWSK